MSLYLGDIPIANDGSHRLTGEIGDIGFAPLGIDESLNLRRYLNGQVISQSQFASFTTKLKARVALYPSLVATEANWQAEVTNSILGQCGKFVIDNENGTIRLPKVINAHGLTDLQYLGTIKNQSLPNITGELISRPYNQNGAIRGASGVFSYTHNGSSADSTSVQVNTTTVKADLTTFDASLSSSTYQNGAPVQQEAVQYPYYIQVATGIEETLPAIREYEINTPFFFGQSKYFENAPYNASWLASNGSYNASTLYPDFWTQLTGVELNNSLNVGDTIEISGKTYVKRGLPVVLSTGTITDYDFVVNQSDETFRLPLLDGSEDLAGNTYENLTLKASGSTYTAPANGWFVFSGVSTGNQGVKLTNTSNGLSTVCQQATSNQAVIANIKCKKGDILSIDYSVASNLNLKLAYAKGNGTLYYYIGDTVQDASLINAGAVLGQLANKADIDASNFNVAGRSLLAGIGMPDITHYVDLTYGASGTSYIASANGYFAIEDSFASGGYVQLRAVDSNDNEIYRVTTSGSNFGGAIILPVINGTKVVLNYGGGINSNVYFRFIYAIGES